MRWIFAVSMLAMLTACSGGEGSGGDGSGGTGSGRRGTGATGSGEPALPPEASCTAAADAGSNAVSKPVQILSYGSRWSEAWSGSPGIADSAVVADLFPGRERLKVAAACREKVYARDAEGTALPGFPYEWENELRNGWVVTAD